MSTIARETQAPAVTERECRARTLEAAALEIEVRGWTQGKLQDDDGRVCAAGAIIAAAPSLIPCHVWGYPDAGHLVNFNNASERTASDVTFVLRWRAEEIRDGR